MRPDKHLFQHGLRLRPEQTVVVGQSFLENLKLDSAILPVLVALGLLNVSCTERSCPPSPSESGSSETLPTLSEAEKAEGWFLLFDGQSFDGWRALGRDAIPPEHWMIEGGSLRKVSSGSVPRAPDGQPIEGGDIITVETYRDFELRFEWKVSPGGNSGIKYNVSEEMSVAHSPPNAALGFEYQVVDDDGHPDGKVVKHQAADLYDLVKAGPSKNLQPDCAFNSGRIVLRGQHGEHWLNGVKVLEYEIGSPNFDSLFIASKYRDFDWFAVRRAGHIVLQDHGDDVWFRNIKARRLDNAENGDPVPNAGG